MQVGLPAPDPTLWDGDNSESIGRTEDDDSAAPPIRHQQATGAHRHRRYASCLHVSLVYEESQDRRCQIWRYIFHIFVSCGVTLKRYEPKWHNLINLGNQNSILRVRKRRWHLETSSRTTGGQEHKYPTCCYNCLCEMGCAHP